jgi:hypothetical protein
MTRKLAATLLSAAALVLLASTGATPLLLVPLGLAALAVKHVLLDRAGREFPQGVLQVLHTLLCTALLVGAFLSFFSRTELTLVYLLSFGVPFLVLRNLATSTPFNDFFIFLVSVLVVVGAAALAGDGAVLITAAYIVAGSLVLPVMAIRDEAGDETTRLHVQRTTSAWKNAPLFAKLGLAGAGFLCGAFLYFLAPRVPPDASPADDGDLGLTEREARLRSGRSRAATEPRPGFPKEPSLGDIGRIKRDDRILLEARLTVDGQPYTVAEGERRMLLLRLRAWDTYVPERRRWTRSRTGAEWIGADGNVSDGPVRVHWSLRLNSFQDHALFVPQLVRQVHSGNVSRDPLGNLTSGTLLSQYSVGADWSALKPSELRRLRPDRSDPNLLFVPPAVAEWIGDHVPVRRGARWHHAVRDIAEKFLRENFRYTLELPPRLAKDTDPMRAFLERKEGHCELYAATACMILRRVGVPARFVGGARCVEGIERGAYLARYNNAHAWVEIPFEGVGFLAFDFTPADSRAQQPTEGPADEEGDDADAQSGASGVIDWTDPLEYGWQDQRRLLGWLSDGILELPWGRIFGVAIALFLVGALLGYRPPKKENPLEITVPAGVASKTLAFYARWLRACAKRGYRRRASQTPREFLSMLPRELMESGRTVTAEFETLRYGKQASAEAG